MSVEHLEPGASFGLACAQAAQEQGQTGQPGAGIHVSCVLVCVCRLPKTKYLQHHACTLDTAPTDEQFDQIISRV